MWQLQDTCDPTSKSSRKLLSFVSWDVGSCLVSIEFRQFPLSKDTWQRNGNLRLEKPLFLLSLKISQQMLTHHLLQPYQTSPRSPLHLFKLPYVRQNVTSLQLGPHKKPRHRMAKCQPPKRSTVASWAARGESCKVFKHLSELAAFCHLKILAYLLLEKFNICKFATNLSGLAPCFPSPRT